MHYEEPVRVKVWGDRACFTRPEMKSERVSYPVMTPSAARGVLEAIFWKPEFSWQVRWIEVLKPIKYFSLVRNEVDRRVSRDAQGFDVAGARTQRHTLGLSDVAYIIAADIVVREGVEDDPAKYRDQFRRRVRKGKCFHRPYLGCREFACMFGEPHGDERPIPVSMDLGMMLLDIEYREQPPHEPHFFAARLIDGVLIVPQHAIGEGRSSPC